MAHSHNKMAGARNRRMSRIPQPTPAFERGAHENQLRHHVHRGGSPSASRCRRIPSAAASSGDAKKRTTPGWRLTSRSGQAPAGGVTHVVHELGRTDARVPLDVGLARRRQASGWAGFTSHGPIRHRRLEGVNRTGAPFPDDVPCDVRSQLFAANYPFRSALNQRALLRRNPPTSAGPLPHQLRLTADGCGDGGLSARPLVNVLGKVHGGHLKRGASLNQAARLLPLLSISLGIS